MVRAVCPRMLELGLGNAADPEDRQGRCSSTEHARGHVHQQCSSYLMTRPRPDGKGVHLLQGPGLCRGGASSGAAL
jgi:hypothetical protein